MKKLMNFSYYFLFIVLFGVLISCTPKLQANKKINTPTSITYIPPQADERVVTDVNGSGSMQLFAVKGNERRLLATLTIPILHNEGKIVGSNWLAISAKTLEFVRLSLEKGTLTKLGIYGFSVENSITDDGKYLVLEKKYPILEGKYDIPMPYIYSLETWQIVREFKPFEFLIKYYIYMDKANSIKVHKKGECTSYSGHVNPDPCEPALIAAISGFGILAYYLEGFDRSPAIVKGHINFSTMNLEIDFMENWLAKMLDNPPKNGKLIIRE